jgi:methyl-accepting chemotaxis protein
MQLTFQMILSEMEESAEEERKQILHHLTELRYAWSNIINGIRGYLAFRNNSNIIDLNLYLERTKKLIEIIKNKGDELTLDQADSIEQFMINLTQFENYYKRLLEIHGSAQWRNDAWLVRGQVTPLLAIIDQQLDQLLSHQESTIFHTSQRL